MVIRANLEGIDLARVTDIEAPTAIQESTAAYHSGSTFTNNNHPLGFIERYLDTYNDVAWLDLTTFTHWFFISLRAQTTNVFFKVSSNQ